MVIWLQSLHTNLFKNVHQYIYFIYNMYVANIFIYFSQLGLMNGYAKSIGSHQVQRLSLYNWETSVVFTLNLHNCERLIYWIQFITINYFLTHWTVLYIRFNFLFHRAYCNPKTCITCIYEFTHTPVSASVFFFLLFSFLSVAEEVFSNDTWPCIFFYM